MRKKIAVIGVFFVLSGWGVMRPAFAVTLMTEREVLRVAFKDMDEVKPETKVLTDEQKADLVGKMDSWVEEKIDMAAYFKEKKFVFYLGLKDGQISKVALILDEPGRWGSVQVCILLHPEGTVQEVIIMRYTETRGRSIARRSFLSQFTGKTVRDKIELHDDITAISGATVSSQAIEFAVKKALLVYKEFYQR